MARAPLRTAVDTCKAVPRLLLSAPSVGLRTPNAARGWGVPHHQGWHRMARRPGRDQKGWWFPSAASRTGHAAIHASAVNPKSCRTSCARPKACSQRPRICEGRGESDSGRSVLGGALPGGRWGGSATSRARFCRSSEGGRALARRARSRCAHLAPLAGRERGRRDPRCEFPDAAVVGPHLVRGTRATGSSTSRRPARRTCGWRASKSGSISDASTSDWTMRRRVTSRPGSRSSGARSL